MTDRTWLAIGSGMIGALVVAALLVGALAFPAMAAPGAQGGILPTPTNYPVTDVTYELERVGGVDIEYTHDFGELDGFTLGTMTAHSLKPNGMVFTLNPTSPNGAIADVLLLVRYVNGSGNRAVAEYDAEAGQWVAPIWETSGARPPVWTPFTFTWRVRDETGVSVETEPLPLEYWDPTREWWRMENDYTVVYWWGFAEDNPDLFARQATELLIATQPRREGGFGYALDYKPVATIYGNREAWSASQGGVSNPSAGGSTNSEFGTTEQYVPAYTENKDERASEWLSETIAHEMTHLYQYELGVSGPTWWVEGQAEYFSRASRPYDARLMNLATLQNLPILAKGEAPRDVEMADGQIYFNYDAGASFVNWLVSVYGLDIHLAIAQQMDQGVPFFNSFEAVFERPFYEVENEWRAYIGTNILTAADMDPSAALVEYEDPLIVVGDTITLPPMPPLVPINEKPGPKSLASGQCFGSMQVEVLRMGTLDDVPYFEVDCMGMIGWLGRESLVGAQ